jgi:hypothetical protein
LYTSKGAGCCFRRLQPSCAVLLNPPISAPRVMAFPLQFRTRWV